MTFVTFLFPIRTPFTQVERHNYVDPDYAFTDQEADQVRNHKQFYIDFIDELREQRQNKTRSK